MMMNVFDIHTHRISSDADRAIASFSVMHQTVDVNAVYGSVGIHPWHLTENNVEVLLQALEEALKQERVVALGEAGLDRLKGAPLDVQTVVFRRQVALSEEYRLPMVIHCVRAFNELLQLKKELRPDQSWIIHGFRGKESVVRELLRHGCYLSFGEKFQPDALRAVPDDRLFIETDESPESIDDICLRIAEARGVSPEELAAVIDKNVREVFFKG